MPRAGLGNGGRNAFPYLLGAPGKFPSLGLLLCTSAAVAPTSASAQPGPGGSARSSSPSGDSLQRDVRQEKHSLLQLNNEPGKVLWGPNPLLGTAAPPNTYSFALNSVWPSVPESSD